MILVVEIVEESEVGSKEDRDSGQLGSTKGSCPKRGRRVSFTPAPTSRGRASADTPKTRNRTRVNYPTVVIVRGQVALVLLRLNFCPTHPTERERNERSLGAAPPRPAQPGANEPGQAGSGGVRGRTDRVLQRNAGERTAGL